MTNDVMIRQAKESDVASIAALLAPHAAVGTVLPRNEENIRFYLQNFRVAWCDEKIVGCVALRDFSNQLFEVRSLVIDDAFQGFGIGRKLVEYEIERLKNILPQWKLFTLTKTPEFFIRLGFQPVEKSLFPEKIWSDCACCPKRDRCDETALLLSEAYQS